jgi:hypothetical protein
MHEVFKFVLDTEILQNILFKNMRGCICMSVSHGYHPGGGGPFVKGAVKYDLRN